MKILIIILFTICFGSVQGQAPRYTAVNGRFNYQVSKVDSFFHIPVKTALASDPYDNSLQLIGKGDTLFYFNNGTWKALSFGFAINPPPVQRVTDSIFYTPNDPFVNNTTAIVMVNPFTVTTLHNSDISFNLPSAAADNYWVVKVPSAEIIKTTWYHNTLNSGTIPDAVIRAAFTVSGFTYYVTRSTFGLDPSSSIQLRQ